ncbi:hypothetical protein KPH14_011021 [Odynerus spinipes]|uniref:Transmembrane protein 70 n=1 Tax=Odynerus spinipes TaxID=1348599 RepID=A0AAD9VV31_9HYME|nr:hypothetical protein KPH14_011021 [Odynerus spinipes]
MSSILRSSLLQKSKNFLQETKILGRSYVLCANHNSNYIKRAVPILQRLTVNNYTKDHKYSEEKNIEIYYGTLQNQIRNLKIFSLGTSACGLAMQPFLILKATAVDSTAGVVGAIIIAVFSVASPLLLHLITKKYVTHVHYDPKEEKYIATTYSLLLRKNKIEFTPADVKIPNVTGIFTTCFIKGKPLFFDERLFNDNSHYVKIMGFDKPMDYKLSDTNYNDITTEKTLSEKIDNKR